MLASPRRAACSLFAAMALFVLALVVGVPPRPAGGDAVAVAHVDPTSSWTVYHGDPLGTGNDTSGVSFSSATQAWKSPVLDGQTYGEPLEATNRVFVATENDTLYALAANSGEVLWSTTVGTPVPAPDTFCGNIGPTVGITGTPVVDVARSEIFAVADELVDEQPAHFLVGVNIYTGAQELNVEVDPAGSSPAHLLQRTGLNLDNGNVVFGFGGNAGDCEPYHGWIVSVPEAGGTPLDYATTGAVPNGTQGAVWMGGAAPEVDASGNIWASTGNGSADTPYDGSDSVIELSPQLQLEQLFMPSDWSFDNDNDRDLGSAAPALMSNGTLLQVGKSQTAFLVNQASLGGMGGDVASAPVCPNRNSNGGNAVDGTIVYIPCFDGIQAIQTSPSLSVLWTAASGSHGAPILASGLVWTIGSSSLNGLDPATGNTVEQLTVGNNANHFPTPSVADGLLLAPANNQVVAFAGSAGIPAPPLPATPAPPNSSYWMVAADGGVLCYGNAGFYGSTGGMTLNEPIVGMAPTPSKLGYWLVASDGGIFSYGDASFYGSMGGQPLNSPIVGVAPTSDRGGYWEVASDGGIFAFGDALFFGSMGGKPLNEPIVGMAPTPDGGGYWEVASDGGIFAFGDANYWGSMGGQPLNKPIVGMTPTADGGGYWMVASDGGIFAFGDALFFGSAGATPLNRPAVGMAASPDGQGYWIAASDGGIFNYGDAGFTGSAGGSPLNQPIVGMASAG